MAGSPRCRRWTTAGSSAMESAWRWRARSTPSWPVQPGSSSPFLMNCCSRGRSLPSSSGAVAHADEFLRGRAVLVEPAEGVFAPALARLVLGGLGHGNELPGVVSAADKLVDHARGGRPGPGNKGRAHAVGVDRRGLQGRNGELVEVGGDHDAGVHVAQLIEQPAHPLGLLHQVARVQPDGAQLVPGDVHGRTDGRFDVVRVHEQRGAGTQRGDLRLKGVAFGVVEQREGMGGGAHGLDPVAEAGLEVGGAVEPGDDGGAGGGRGRFLLGPPGAHFDAGPVAGGGDHPGGRRGDGAVVVQHGQDVGLQDAGLGERRFDDQDGGVREVGLALGIAPDVPGEAEVGQVVQGLLVDHAGARPGTPVQRRRSGRPRCPPAAGRCRPRSRSAGRREPARERLEDGLAVRGAGMERGLQHGQFVVISEQGRAWLVPARGGTHKITLVRLPIEWTDDLKRCARP